jgi:hypothetical protein
MGTRSPGDHPVRFLGTVAEQVPLPVDESTLPAPVEQHCSVREPFVGRGLDLVGCGRGEVLDDGPRQHVDVFLVGDRGESGQSVAGEALCRAGVRVEREVPHVEQLREDD